MYPEAMITAVLNAIPLGRENARIADDIHRIARTPREWRTQIHTREIINLLRQRGEPICSRPSAPAGYWRSRAPVELIECADSLSERARKIELTARALRETASALRQAGNYEGQMLLGDDAPGPSGEKAGKV